MRRRNKVFNFRNFRHGVPLPPFQILKVRGPLSRLNPTSAIFQTRQTVTFESVQDTRAARRSETPDPSELSVAYYWTSRNNRKGRHALMVSPNRKAFAQHLPYQDSSRSRALRAGLHRMVTRFPYWDISFIIAIMALFGSAFWTVNGLLLLLPYYHPNAVPEPTISLVTRIVPVIASAIYVILNILLVLESVNEHRGQCFGWEMQGSLTVQDGATVRMAPGNCQHHHANEKSPFGPSEKKYSVGLGRDKQHNSATTNIYNNFLSEEDEDYQTSREPETWRWYPRYTDLVSHYLWDLGFLASSIQLIAVSIFNIGNILGLPPIFRHMSPATVYIFYWAPKLAGGLGLMTASWMFMIETQNQWYLPAPRRLGWYIGALNLIGSSGFVVSPSLGVIDWIAWAQKYSAIASLIGGGAFFVSALLLWYESLQKYNIVLGHFEKEFR